MAQKNYKKISSILPKKLIKPVDTRWYSFYELYVSIEAQFPDVMTHLPDYISCKLNRNIIKMFIKVLKPIIGQMKLMGTFYTSNALTKHIYIFFL